MQLTSLREQHFRLVYKRLVVYTKLHTLEVVPLINIIHSARLVINYYRVCQFKDEALSCAARLDASKEEWAEFGRAYDARSLLNP